MTTPAPTSWPREVLEHRAARAAAAQVIPAPTSDTLLCQPEDVARRLGVTATLSETQRQRLLDAIADATADVEAELGRPLIPTKQTFLGALPLPGVDLTRVDAWPVLRQVDDVVTVTTYSRAGEPGRYDLVVRVGLDGPATAPIVRYIIAAAAESVRHDPSSGIGKVAVTSVSAEGQSISYEARSSVDGAAGSAPTLKSLRRYKRLPVYRRRTVNLPFGYGGTLPG